MIISVCIPTYNQATYIEQSIRSVMGQTLLPDEIIVSNDCSTDNTFEILEDLKREISILKVIHQPVNLGMVANTNLCLRMAAGEFIIKLDSDDYLLPDYTKILSAKLKINVKAGYAHAAVNEIDEYGTIRKKRVLFRTNDYIDADEALKTCIKGYKVTANIIMFRRTALEAVNYITSNVEFAEDYYLSAEIAAAGFGNVYNPNILSCYRMWSDSGDIRKKRKLNEINGLRIIFEKVFEPAFRSRKWGFKKIIEAKENFARTHASCLGWNVFNPEEKKTIEKAILRLSSTKRTRTLIWLYKNGLGKVIDLNRGLREISRRRIKISIQAFKRLHRIMI